MTDEELRIACLKIVNACHPAGLGIMPAMGQAQVLLDYVKHGRIPQALPPVVETKIPFDRDAEFRKAGVVF